MHQSRRRRAMQVIADNEHLLVTAETIEPPLEPLHLSSGRSRKQEKSRPAAAASPGALLGAIAIVLIAMHAICAALIIDRALAHAPAQPTISQGD
jgi:hypothetical protein